MNHSEKHVRQVFWITLVSMDFISSQMFHSYLYSLEPPLETCPFWKSSPASSPSPSWAHAWPALPVGADCCSQWCLWRPGRSSHPIPFDLFSCPSFYLSSFCLMPALQWVCSLLWPCWSWQKWIHPV